MEAPLLQVIHPFSHVASMIFKEAQLPGAMPAVLLEAGQLEGTADLEKAAQGERFRHSKDAYLVLGCCTYDFT